MAKDVVFSFRRLDAPLSKPINGIAISHPHKRTNWLLEFRVVFLDLGRCDWVFEDQVNYATNNMLEMLK